MTLSTNSFGIFRTTLWSLGLASILMFSACPEEKPVVPEPECSTAADCNGPAADIGQLCVEGKCVACADSEACAADSRYGDGAVCIDGMCTTCVDGEVGCACLDGQYCIEGRGCEDDGLCHPCQPGEDLCACDSGSCAEGLSCADDDICRADTCTAGQADCACAEGSCDDGLVCGEDSCRACPVDVEGCPCNSDGTCDIDLVCDDDSQTCRAPTSCSELECGEHRLCGENAGSFSCLEDCATGYRWNSTDHVCETIPTANCNAGAEASILADCQSAHRVCIESGDSAHCGACIDDGSECWLGPQDQADGACVAAITCTDCDAQHRECTAADACGDATCGDCLAGFHADGEACVAHTTVASCDECTADHRACATDSASNNYCSDCLEHWTDNAGTCVGVDNCEEGADNSIFADCGEVHRTCVEATAIADAHCGDCDPDYLEDTETSVCMLDSVCHSDADCESDLGWHCVQMSTSDAAHCRKSQCEEGQAWNRYAADCKTCSISCTAGDALTGQVWPATDRNGNCYCETKPGYYWDSATESIGAHQCDADGDGWLNQTVDRVISGATPANGEPDMTAIVNARCDFKNVYSFILVNEWGQQKILDVGDYFGDLLSGKDYVTLYESTRNDRNEQDEEDGGLPSYGSLRRFTPAEVNGLTKACVSTTVDLNDNEISDYIEDQSAVASMPWQNVFNRLSFFTELFTGEYQDGQYYITARSRCDTQGFMLKYSANDPQVAQDGSSYWRSCSRRRDKDFDHTKPLGYDFARYDACGDIDGACPFTWDADWGLQSPGTRPSPQPPVGVASWSEIQPHGACDGLDVSMEAWRGMGHAEQFDCVLVKGTPNINNPEQVALSDLYATGTSGHMLQANVCSLTAVGEANPFTCTQPDDATSLSYLQNDVIWVARRFEPYTTPGDYPGGCIDEWAEWRQLCPGYLTSSAPEDTIKGEGKFNDFGSLVCGCSRNYGGADCSQGCPDDRLLVSDDYQTSPRQGTWMCAQIAASEATPLTDPDVDGGYRLVGSVPAHAGGTGVLCEDQDGGCNSGYTLR